MSFRHTGLYQESLSILGEIIKSFRKETDEVLKAEVTKEALKILKEMAQSILRKSGSEDEIHFHEARKRICALTGIIELSQAISATNHENSLQKLKHLESAIEHFQKKRKRILILSSTFGHGHMSAAKGIQQGLENLYGQDYIVEIVDFGILLNTLANKTGMKLYEGSSKFTPKIYKFFFDLTDNDNIWQLKLLNFINYPFAVSRLTKFFNEKNPDLIISTFVFWDYVAMAIWKKHKPETRFMNIITDSITIHRAWLTSGTDYHIVPNKDTADALLEMGVDAEKIKTLGFPVCLNFLAPFDRREFLEKQKLNPKKFTVLFLPTAQQAKKNRQIMDALLKSNQEYNIVVITGRDEKAREAFEPYDPLPSVKLIGWTDEMASFIKSSDVVITKAGGATLMECLAAKKPMIVTSVIEGQESGNAELLERHHLGILALQKNSDIGKAVKTIQKNYASYQKNLEKMSNPEAALKIAKFVRELMET